MKYCINCHSSLEDNAHFCPNCGAPQPAQFQQQAQPFNMASVPQPPKQKNPLILVVIILAGLLVAGIVAAIIYFASNKEEAAVQPIETATATTDVAVVDTVAEATMAATSQPAIEEPAKAEKKRVSSPYDYVINGSVGKYKVMMEISFQAGGNIKGRYRYKRMNGVGGWLFLHGTHHGNSYEMYETTNNGDVTGTFSGSYTISGTHLKMSGSIMNSKADVYSFNASGEASE